MKIIEISPTKNQFVSHGTLWSPPERVNSTWGTTLLDYVRPSRSPVARRGRRPPRGAAALPVAQGRGLAASAALGAGGAHGLEVLGAACHIVNT